MGQIHQEQSVSNRYFTALQQLVSELGCGAVLRQSSAVDKDIQNARESAADASPIRDVCEAESPHRSGNIRQMETPPSVAPVEEREEAPERSRVGIPLAEGAPIDFQQAYELLKRMVE